MRLEPTVYWLDSNNYNTIDLTDEQFIDTAEKFGKVSSLSGFQEAFNLGEINIASIRIVWRRTDDTMFGVEVANYTESEEYIDDLPII